jgi:2-keto-4-pentenoate hydratase/2-oxohepta-3-ene-1,7-dioic acid hydratase in catechol pathway
MRLATIVFASRPCLVVSGLNDQLFLVEALLEGGRHPAPTSLLELVEQPEVQRKETMQAISRALSESRVAPVQAQEWLPPVGRPSKVVGVALNNSSLARFAYRYFERPAFFLKAPSSMIGHQQTISVRESFGLTHPEPELAVVIGQRTANVKESDALSRVFGYTIINDITSVGLKDEDSIQFRIPLPGGAVTWRKRKGLLDRDIYLTYHGRSKSTDTFGPMGPFVVTADEIPDPNNLRVRSWLGDELVAEDSTANLRFSVPTVLAHLSAYMTLEPGDIVHMGTAVKSYLPTLRSHDMRKKHGDSTVEIESIGRLVNPVEVTP